MNASNRAPDEQIEVLGVAIDCVDFAATLDHMDRWIAECGVRSAERGVRSAEHNSPLAPRPSPPARQICTVNPEFIIDAGREPAFAAVLRRADLRVPDGVGILWAARRLGHPLRERVTGSDGIYRITQHAAENGYRVFFLGAGPGVALQTALRLQARYPQLSVAGAYDGSPEDASWPTISGWLAATRPDILFVAFGHPKQEYWIDKHRHELPVAVAIGVGGAFDFVAGVTKRAPRWMRGLGIEWLYRLIREPWRWRRMRKLPLFAVRVLFLAGPRDCSSDVAH